MPIRALVVLLAVAFALLAPASQALVGWGQSAGAFAREGDEALRAADWAFSIWGLIYLGLAAYALYQVLPVGRDRPLAQALGWPAAVAAAGCGLWLIAAGYDADWASVAIILAATGAIVGGLWRAAARRTPATRLDGLLILWPLGLLAGWLTVAAALNVLNVLTAQGLIDPTSPVPGLAGIAAVVGIGAVVLRATRLGAYGLPIAWGLMAVGVAERPQASTLGAAAWAGAALIAVVAVVELTRRRFPAERRSA